jgi:hypothetical protein
MIEIKKANMRKTYDEASIMAGRLIVGAIDSAVTFSSMHVGYPRRAISVLL